MELLRLQPCADTLSFRTAEWTLLAVRHVERALSVDVGSGRQGVPALADVGLLLPPDAAASLEVPGGQLTLDLVLFPPGACLALRPLSVAFRPHPGPWFDPQVGAWIDELWEEAPSDGPVATLARWIGQKADLATTIPTEDHPLPPSRARRVVSELAARSRSTLDLASLAEPCGLAPGALSRSFRSIFGQPPSRYLTVLRVESAARRLHAPGPVDLHSIALESGFYDQSHMNRQFKRILDLTPGEYRERA